MQDCGNSITSTLELPQSCAKPLKCSSFHKEIWNWFCFSFSAKRKVFEAKRSKHYNEFQAIKLARQLMEQDEDEDEDEDGGEEAGKWCHYDLIVVIVTTSSAKICHQRTEGSARSNSFYSSGWRLNKVHLVVKQWNKPSGHRLNQF